MNEAPEAPRTERTQARPRRGRWPGLVWAIPLAALLVVAYLGVTAIANRGVDVVVTFKTSGGARAGDTPVVYKGVTVGRVAKIRIAENARDVEMTLRLERRIRPGLREGAKFWLIGAEPDLTDLSSLRAVVSGVSIGMSPGAGAPKRQFAGLGEPPAVPPDTPGALYSLEGQEIGSTRIGSGVYYHGLQVGRVTRLMVLGPQRLRLVIFINAPYDQLVRPESLFFIARAADVTLTAGHLGASLGPGSSIITGGIEFDTPATASSRQSPPDATFHFYPDKVSAAEQARGPEVPYRAVFKGAAELPQAEAPVWLSGLRIGKVIEAHVVLRPGALAPETQVAFELEPQALGLRLAGTARATADEAVTRLLKGGYRLAMDQSPPLIGAAALAFLKSEAKSPAVLGRGDPPEVPTAAAPGFGDVAADADAILKKVNAVPIVAIGQDVRRITQRIDALVSSPKVGDSLAHLDSALAQADAMMREVRPQVGPLTAKLRTAADEVSATAAAARGLLSGEGADQDAGLPEAVRQLNGAARSIRDLADYLERHPEALVRGRAKEPQ